MDSLTPEEYKKKRKKLGTQAQVASMLGIARETLNRRESGNEKYPITRETFLSMLHLEENKNFSARLLLEVMVRASLVEEKPKTADEVISVLKTKSDYKTKVAPHLRLLVIYEIVSLGLDMKAKGKELEQEKSKVNE